MIQDHIGYTPYELAGTVRAEAPGLGRAAKTVCNAVFGMTLMFTGSLAVADSLVATEKSRIHIAKLFPSTGFNSDCDQPIFQLPGPVPADLHFDFIGLYNSEDEGDSLPRDTLPLVPADCDSGKKKLIATNSNDAFRAFLNFPEPDPRLKNLLSNQVPIIAFPDGSRTALPPQGVLPPPLPASRSLPAEPQTLGGFRDVSGQMKVRCRKDGTAIVRIKVQGYDHNSLVTVGALWLTTPPGATTPSVIPAPFGGVPNVLAINPNGEGRFVRELGYCPTEVQPNGSQLLAIAIDEHWDGSNSGAQPDLPLGEAKFLLDPNDPGSAFTSSIGAGIGAVNRGMFPMTVKPW